MTDLYIIIYDLLRIVPKDIINIIAQYAIKYSKYTCNTPSIYKTMHYNEQLGIIYCASDYSYKLINYNDGRVLTNRSNATHIDIKSFDSKFTYVDTQGSARVKNIIHFNNDRILIDDNPHSYMYIPIGTQYVLNKIRFMQDLQASCTYNQKLYMCYHLCDSARISEYELMGFDYKNQTDSFEFNEKHDIQISANDDFVYVMQSISKTKHDVCTYDTHTLHRLDYHNVFKTSASDIVKIYKDRIFSYRDDRIHIYDILTMDEIESFNVQSFASNNTVHSMIISNDLLMLSNDEQIMFYDVGY